jgi:hypothetical protein
VGWAWKRGRQEASAYLTSLDFVEVANVGAHLEGLGGEAVGDEDVHDEVRHRIVLDVLDLQRRVQIVRRRRRICASYAARINVNDSEARHKRKGGGERSGHTKELVELDEQDLGLEVVLAALETALEDGGARHHVSHIAASPVGVQHEVPRQQSQVLARPDLRFLKCTHVADRSAMRAHRSAVAEREAVTGETCTSVLVELAAEAR